MNVLEGFEKSYKCFNDMSRQTDLKNKVIRFDDPESKEERIAIIIAHTVLPTDIMLHMVDATDLYHVDDVEEAIEDYGIEFRLLSQILGYNGFDILPSDQLEEGEYSYEDEKQSEVATNEQSFTDNIGDNWMPKFENMVEIIETDKVKENRTIGETETETTKETFSWTMEGESQFIEKQGLIKECTAMGYDTEKAEIQRSSNFWHKIWKNFGQK